MLKRGSSVLVASVTLFLSILSSLGTPTTTSAFMIAPTNTHTELRHPNQNKMVPPKKESTQLLATTPTSSSSSSSDDERTLWTTANLFWFNDTVLCIYHSIGIAWDNLVPFGALLGALAYEVAHYQPYPTLLQTTGMAAWWTALAVSVLGVAKLFLLDLQRESIAIRAQQLKVDYAARVMDQSVYIGCILALVVLWAAGGPTELGLTPGTDGYLQGVMLGSCGGSVLGWIRQRQK